MFEIKQPVPAPAKINLYLKALGRRGDGYHELDTVMARLDLADFVDVEIGGGEDTLYSSSNIGPLPPDFDGPDNLMLRAVRVFRAAAKGWPREGVALRVEKNIPLGAGLGGGSSDCAAVLRVLNALAPAPLSPKALLNTAKSLGADVPFFVGPRTLARARGIGEVLTGAPPAFQNWAGREIILVNPGIVVPTGRVFQTLGLTNPPPDNNLGPLPEPVPGDNDLFPAACKVAPELKGAAFSIKQLKPIHWGLSGSGATFWLFSGNTESDFAVLKSGHPGCWVRKTVILN